MIVCSEGEHTEETRIALGFQSNSGGSWAFALLAGVRGHSLNLSGSSEGNGAWEVKGGKRVTAPGAKFLECSHGPLYKQTETGIKTFA